MYIKVELITVSAKRDIKGSSHFHAMYLPYKKTKVKDCNVESCKFCTRARNPA